MRDPRPACILALPALLAAAPKVPPDIQAQWARFQAALAADDVPALTAMVRFPVRCNEFEGDIRTPRAFAKQYRTLFPEATKHCFATAGLHPVRQGKKTWYEAWCDVGEYPIRFIFEQVGAELRLTTIDNINE